MKNWKINSWRNYPVKHIPEYPDKKELDGVLGKINDFQQSEDGRILINLTGINRFEIIEEIKNEKLYREFRVE